MLQRHVHRSPSTALARCVALRCARRGACAGGLTSVQEHQGMLRCAAPAPELAGLGRRLPLCVPGRAFGMRSLAALLLLAGHRCYADGPPVATEVALARDTTMPASSAKSSAAETKKENELFSWLRDEAGLSQAVIDKSKAKLSEEDVDSVEALQALQKLGDLDDVFSRVPAAQIADALAAAAAPEVKKNPWENGEPGHWDTVTGEWVPDAPGKKGEKAGQSKQNVTGPAAKKNPWETGEPGHWDTATGEWVPDAPAKTGEKAGQSEQNVTGSGAKKNPWETGEPGHWDTVTGKWVPDAPGKKGEKAGQGKAGEGGHGATLPPKEGRCGPLFNETRCDCSQASWAVFCVSENGWCGDSAEHAKADKLTKYDCPLELREAEPAEGRCGALFGGARCDCSKDSSFKFCNSENGWCGDSADHANADAFTRYDCREHLRLSAQPAGRCGPLFEGSRCDCSKDASFQFCNSANGWCGDSAEHATADDLAEYDCLTPSVAADEREAQDRRGPRRSLDAPEVKLQGLEDRCQAAGTRCQAATVPISADTEKACSLAAACRLQEAESRSRKASGGGSTPAATGIRGERLRYELDSRQGRMTAF